ncbi:MAG TPA: hypothetical protein VJ742_03195 [Nitrososphaera sp.]|nr:hypothetical protein [Nitrososphaera sp.]
MRSDLAKLPDSPIKQVPFPPSKPHPTRFQQYPITFKVSIKEESGEIVYYLDEIEIFRAAFNAENYATVFFEKVKADDKYLDGAISDEQRTRFYAKSNHMTLAQTSTL